MCGGAAQVAKDLEADAVRSLGAKEFSRGYNEARLELGNPCI